MADDVFEVGGERPRQQGMVELFVNGESRGTINVAGQTLGQFVSQQVNRAGIRSFSVYVDNAKIGKSQGNMDMGTIGKVEIVSKDARGSASPAPAKRKPGRPKDSGKPATGAPSPAKPAKPAKASKVKATKGNGKIKAAVLEGNVSFRLDNVQLVVSRQGLRSVLGQLAKEGELAQLNLNDRDYIWGR